MQNQNAYLDCTKHPNQRVSSLNFDEYISENSRLLCSLCQIDLPNKNQKKNYSLVDIDEFLKNPNIQVQRVMKQDGQKSFCDLKYLQQLEKEINLIEDKFEQSIIALRDKFQQDFYTLSKLNSLIEQYDIAIWQQDDQLKKIYVKSFEERKDFVSKNLNSAKLQANQNVVKSQEVLTNMFQNHLQVSIQDIKRFQEVSIATFNLNNIQGLPLIIYEELKNFPLIHYKISEGKATQYQLLSQGYKDGLNLKQYQSKCFNQSNLLSCQFGDGNLVFDVSFSEFSSNLGISYDISNYDIQYLRSHIFGEQNPQITEFKVYKVIFNE